MKLLSEFVHSLKNPKECFELLRYKCSVCAYMLIIRGRRYIRFCLLSTIQESQEEVKEDNPVYDHLYSILCTSRYISYS